MLGLGVSAITALAVAVFVWRARRNPWTAAFAALVALALVVLLPLLALGVLVGRAHFDSQPPEATGLAILAGNVVFWSVVLCRARSAAALVLILLALPVLAAELPRVKDGDSFEFGGVDYRLEGVDTPEVRNHCPAEAILGFEAAVLLQRIFERCPDFTIVPAGDAKFDVLARVTACGRNVAETLIGAGLGRPYDGKRARLSWCPAR